MGDVQHATRKTLELVRIARAQPQMMQLHLSLRPGECRGTLEVGHRAMLVYQVECGLAARRDHCPEGDVGRRAGCDQHARAQRKDRIENGTGRPRQRAPVDDRARSPRTPAPPDELRTVGFELGTADGVAIDDDEVRCPDIGFGWIAAAAVRKQCAAVEVLRFDEQLGEHRMREIGRLRCQREFRIRRDFDDARLCAGVGDADPARLRIVLGGDQHGHCRSQIAVAAHELGAVLVEGDAVGIRFEARRLKSRRPDAAVAAIAQEDVRAPVVAGRILAPARHGEVAPAAEPRTRRRQHHRIAAVREQVRCGYGRIGVGKMSAGRWFDFLDLPRQTPLLSDAREGFRDLTRHAFLQQKLGRPDHRLGVEAVAHDAAQDRICERQDRHSLVMRHEIAHDGDVAALQQPGGRIVEGFVEAVAAAAAGCFERLEIAQRGVRLNHGGEGRRIGCDHHIVAQPALEPEAGHAEVRILVGQLQIAGVVGGLGDAPRRPELKTIVDLSRDDAAFGALEQAAGGRAHDQRGHQILEHRSRPRD